MTKESFAFLIYEQAPLEFISEITGIEINVLEELTDTELQNEIDSAVMNLPLEQIEKFKELHVFSL